MNNDDLEKCSVRKLTDFFHDVLHLVNCPKVFSHVLPPRPFPWCARIPQMFFQYILHFVTFTTRKKLFIPFDVYFYHLVIPCFYSLNNPTTPHEPTILNLIQIPKTNLNFASFLQFFSGQFTSFMVSAPSHFPINSSFYSFPNSFTLSCLSIFVCSD